MTGTQQSQKTIYCSLVFIVNFVSFFVFILMEYFVTQLDCSWYNVILLCCVLNCVLMCVSAHFKFRAGRAVVYFLLQSFSINYYNMLHVFFSTSEGKKQCVKRTSKREKRFKGGQYFSCSFFCVFIINNNCCPHEQTTWSIYLFFFSSSSFFVHDF